MLGLKSTLITAALGVTVALTLAFLWKSEQAKSARLEGELSQALANTVTLKQAVQNQKEAFEKMSGLVDQNGKRVEDLMQERDNAYVETARVRSEINLLRAAEDGRALQAPFSRGNFARERFTYSLQRIANAPSRASTSGHDTNVTKGSHSE